MTRNEARALLEQMTQNASLLRHMRSIEIVMEAYAQRYGENTDQWAMAGLLHDADYELYPTQHPDIIVAKLRESGEPAIAHAISAHYTKWNVSYDTVMDKALLACDEITGFIIACCQVRPDGINSLEAKSVIKKLKDKSFAAKVEREEVYQGAELLGVDLQEHISFIINTLREHKSELAIG